MWIKAKYTFIKTVYSPRFYGGPYLQAKHADVCSSVLFWTACTRRPLHVLSLPSSSGCEKSDSWWQARSVKTAKKVMNGTTMVMWHWIVYKWRRSNKMLSFRHIFFNLLNFTVSLSYRDWHSETPWSQSSNQPGGTYCQAQISCCTPTIHWKCDAQIQNRQIKSPPALWRHLSFQCLGVIVTLNGKSASMLLKPTKNKLKQWRVIEKSVNKCIFFFSDVLNHNKMNENNRKTNLWRSNSYI